MPEAWTVHLRGGGTAVLIDVGDSGLPAVLHWGEDWGAMDDADLASAGQLLARAYVDNVPDIPLEAGVLPAVWTGWTGQPGISGHRPDGTCWSPRLRTVAVHVDGSPVEVGTTVEGGNEAVFDLEDPHCGLTASVILRIAAGGVVEAQASVTNTGADRYDLVALNLALPVPLEADELLDFTGRWTRERAPQRRAVTVGAHLREQRRGRPGFDSPTVMLCGRQGFGFRHGRVWGLHIGTGGNSRTYVERLAGGHQVLGGGDSLHPGEVSLQPGETHTGPVLRFTHGEGLDEAARRFHAWVRALPGTPDARRPVTLNVWEAVGFDHTLPKLLELADAAAAIGVERYVLDDGWFLGRRDDAAGLGDWAVDPTVWPDGLHPLVDHVRGLGMQFGLWFEPEMVNPDSELAREHPEWILAAHEEWPLPWRRQQVLDLTIDEARDLVWSRMDALVREYRLDYIKWDHNRDTFDAGSQASGGRAVNGRQVAAALEIMDRLRRDHPGLEIESCASGGARIDLEMARHVQRFWVSDCIDPLERQHMLRWTMQLMPPECLGSHVASGRSQTTSREHDLSFRAGTAIWGHLGVEWDLTEATEEELAELKDWFDWFKVERGLILGGDMVREVVGQGPLWLHGVVAPDRRRALYSIASIGSGPDEVAGRVRFPGLQADLRYRVRANHPGRLPAGFIAPPWLASGIEATGAVLQAVGVTAPTLHPDQVLILEASAIIPNDEGVES
ncbi:alpha-galactosidase [Arachnia propionica]|uniref:Alpha-galactosidase n=1 Tax=Arachnia propionica TaxID=1750 RepID=A0A3P1WPY2_9ACTN|nr:alpha-galactosidase [Arachnia propionica]RRD48652.1 alpha-galactosidase [Arachnia propionica]